MVVVEGDEADGAAGTDLAIQGSKDGHWHEDFVTETVHVDDQAILRPLHDAPADL